MENKTIVKTVIEGEDLQHVFNVIMELPTKIGNPLLAIISKGAIYEETPAQPAPKKPAKQGNRR